MNKIDRRRFPDIECDGQTYSYNGNETPLEQVLAVTGNKSIFLVGNGGQGKSTVMRSLWLDSICYKENSKAGEEHPQCIYVDLKLLSRNENTERDGYIRSYIKSIYNIDIEYLSEADEKPILLLDGANEATADLREKSNSGVCVLVQEFENLLENFRLVISSRSKHITIDNSYVGSGKDEFSQGVSNRLQYCNLCNLGDEIIDKKAPQIEKDSVLYKLLKNNMMLHIYENLSNYGIEIDQNKITAGKLLELYFDICFKTRYVMNTLQLRINEVALYDTIKKIEGVKRQKPKVVFQSSNERSVAQALEYFDLIYDYLVNCSGANKIEKKQLRDRLILSELEHTAILSQSDDETYVWANEIYQDFFESKKLARAIKLLSNSDIEEAQIAESRGIIKKYPSWSDHSYQVIQYAGEISEIAPSQVNYLYKNRALAEDKDSYLCKRFVTVLSVLTGNGFPEGIESVGRFLFMNCSNLTSIHVPETVTVIKESAFAGCVNLTNIFIPKSVTCIEACAFSDCKRLEYITIPREVTFIRIRTFKGCSSLRSIKIHDGVTGIGNGAFEDCSGLTTAYIGNSVMSIGRLAFRNCNSLTDIFIPSGVTSIGKDSSPLECDSWDVAGWGFHDDDGGIASCGLTSIKVDERNTVYHSAGNCIIETATKTLIAGCKNSIIPNDGSVASIRGYAFYNCSALNNIIIPYSVTQIDDDAFLDCSGLECITVSSGNEKYHSSGNCLIETASKTLILGGKNSVIPNDGSVININEEAFYNCSGLTDITIPDGIISIGKEAFNGCINLTKVSLPDSVKKIGLNAFKDCHSLKTITIPAGITNFEVDSSFERNSVVYGCCNLNSITVSPNNKKYHSAGNCIIETATKLLIAGCNNSIIPNDGSVTGIRGYAFSGCSELKNIIIPDCVTGIGNYAFSGCSSLKNVMIPNSVNFISFGAFHACDGLESITIPFVGREIVSDSDKHQFPFGYIFSGGCSGADKVYDAQQWFYNSDLDKLTDTHYYIPSSLKNVTVTGGNILSGAFSNCRSLSTITIPESVTSIGEYAFFKCGNLTNITIPNGVKSIGTGAFYECSNLKKIKIPISVTEIGKDAFQGCDNLTVEREDLLDIILDEDNQDPILMMDQRGKQLAFEQVAIIPYEQDGEKVLYVILKPLDKINGIEDDQAVVFLVDQDSSGNTFLRVEDDEAIAIDVFCKYYDLLSEIPKDDGDD